MTYYELAQAIDQVPREVTKWEAHFLDSILQLPKDAPLSQKRQAKLRELGEAYLSPQTMLEFNGQLSLELEP